MHSGFALAEKVGEVLGVEFAEAASIVDGLAYDEHGGEGEVVVVDNLGEVFEHTTIDLLIWPCEMITGIDWRILWVLCLVFPRPHVGHRRSDYNSPRTYCTLAMYSASVVRCSMIMGMQGSSAVARRI